MKYRHRTICCSVSSPTTDGDFAAEVPEALDNAWNAADEVVKERIPCIKEAVVDTFG